VVEDAEADGPDTLAGGGHEALLRSRRRRCGTGVHRHDQNHDADEQRDQPRRGLRERERNGSASRGTVSLHGTSPLSGVWLDETDCKNASGPRMRSCCHAMHTSQKEDMCIDAYYTTELIYCLLFQYREDIKTLLIPLRPSYITIPFVNNCEILP
jgi:hypothetical protein